MPDKQRFVVTVDLGEHLSGMLDDLVQEVGPYLKSNLVNKRQKVSRSDVLREAVRALWYDLRGQSYLQKISEWRRFNRPWSPDPPTAERT